MLTNFRHSLLGLTAALGALLLPSLARAAAAPVILSLSYDSTAPSQYIGTSLKVYMTAIQPSPTAPFPVSVTAYTAGATGSVTLGGLFSGVVAIGAIVYVSDGIRTWAPTYTGGGTITINSATLLPATIPSDPTPPSWVVSDYSLFANMTFTVYTGTLVSNATAAAQITVDIGQFAQVSLYDNASNGDAHSGDGIWTGQYTTPNLGSVVTGAYFYGQCLVGGAPALNENFQSSQSVNFDMELPVINAFSQSTTNPSYNGDLYLSSASEGLSSANPVNVNPSSAQAQFNFTVNKVDTAVVVTVGDVGGAYGYPMVPDQLPTFVFPTGSVSLNGWSVWNGSDGSAAQNFVPDGIYPVYYYVYDINGLSSVTITSKIKVVSLQMSLSNITMTPPIINTLPVINNGVLSNISYSVVLTNDSSNSAKMNSSLRVLGWRDAGQTSASYLDYNGQAVTTTAINGINSVADVESTVWTMLTQGTLSPSGSFTAFPPPVDANDWDTTMAGIFLSYFSGYGQDNPKFLVGQCPADSYPIDTHIVTGNGVVSDDWWPKGFTPLGTVNGVLPATSVGANPGFGFTSSTAPVSISTQVDFNWMGSTPAQGQYRIDLTSQLTGLAFSGGPPTPSSNPTVNNPCNTTLPAQYYADAYHFWPQTQTDEPSGLVSTFPVQGDLIYSQNTSAIFVVDSSANPTGDNTPPQFLVSNPVANALVQPGVYSTATPLSVEFQDTAANFNTGVSASYITLTGPTGNPIGGQSSSNLGAPGGMFTLYFQPDTPLVAGGGYVMNAFTCNVDGLCVQQSIPFTVLDITAPSIVSNGVVLTSQLSTTTIPISQCQSSPAGPFQNISQLAVTIAMPATSKNTIYLPGCSVSLYQISGTSQVAVAMTQLASQNVSSIQATLVYQINSVLNSAANYEVVTQTESLDASGQGHVGPPAQPSGSNCTNTPQFTITPCTLCLNLEYTNNPSSSRPAVTGFPPITVTSGTSPVSLLAVTAAQPLSLPAYPGYSFLSTANKNSELQFFVSAVPQTTELTWTYGTSSNLIFSLWFAPGDLTGTITASDLRVVGYDGGSWHPVANASVPISPTASNIQCIVPVPNASPAYVYYALAYPSGVTSTPVPTGGTTPVTPLSTPVTFPSTRAFDPWNSNPIYQKARFYYASVAPQSINARVYDTAGRLIRSLSLGDGISASQATTDPVYGNTMYYFEWDGTNAGGTLVHNGIYLVRWNEIGTDGNHNTQTKPVALIK